jgi:hypothetical protein
MKLAFYFLFGAEKESVNCGTRKSYQAGGRPVDR